MESAIIVFGIIIAFVLKGLGVATDIQAAFVIIIFEFIGLVMAMTTKARSKEVKIDGAIVVNRNDPKMDLLSFLWDPDINHMKDGDLIIFVVQEHKVVEVEEGDKNAKQ